VVKPITRPNRNRRHGAMSDFSSTGPQPEEPRDGTDRLTRVPRAAQARLLLHDLESDPPFADMLREALPDEAARLAYLNHLAWQARS
jgi:hypothetical protein